MKTLYFPEQFVKESAKNKEWFKSHAEYVANVHSVNSSAEMRRLENNFNQYNGVVEKEKIKDKVAPTGHVSKVVYRKHGLTRAMVSSLYNEFISMSIDDKLSAIDKESIIRKEQHKMDVVLNKVFKEYEEKTSEALGFDVTEGKEQLPVPDDIDMYMKMEYRDAVETQINDIINYMLVVMGKREQINYAFLNYLITGRTTLKAEEEDNWVSIRQIDPRLGGVAKTFNSDYSDNSQLAYEVRYLSAHELTHMYYNNPDLAKDKKLSKDEIRKLLNAEQDFISEMNVDGRNFAKQKENGEWEYQVVTVQWIGKRIYSYKESENKKRKGLIHRKRIKEDEKVAKDEKKVGKLIDELYQATLIAGTFLVDWGRVENQIRSVDSPEKVQLDYIQLSSGNTNNTAMSLVEKLTYFEEMDNDLYYAIRQALYRSAGKAVVYDMAQLPTEFFGTPKQAMQTVAYHLRENNIIWINTKKGGLNKSSFNQFKDIDFSLSQSITSMINLKAMNMEAASFATGINPQRRGDISQYATDQTTQMSIEQSVVRTREYFMPFNKLVTKALIKCANKAKFIIEPGKKVAFINGDKGPALMTILPGLPLADYGFYFGDKVKDKEVKMKIESFASQMLVNSQEPRMLLEMIKIIKADSGEEAEALFEKGIEALEKIKEQQKQAETERLKELEAMKQETQKMVNENNEKDRASREKIADINALNRIDVAMIKSEDDRDIALAGSLKELYLKQVERMETEQNAKKSQEQGGEESAETKQQQQTQSQAQM